MKCKLAKKCKAQDDLLNCWNPSCSNWIHQVCYKLVLDYRQVPLEDRPGSEERTESGEAVVFCTKTCFTVWRTQRNRELKAAAQAAKAALEASKKKRKVPWEDDGSMEVLMDWITTHGNYAAYSGANGHQNKGKSKAAYHKEIALLIQQKKPESERDAKDVENKIGTLERQFREASDWANNTGQGVENPGEFEAAVKKRCPYYEQLEPIMGERPNAAPLATNEDGSSQDENEEEDTDQSVAPVAVAASIETPLAKDSNKNQLSSLSSKTSKGSSRTSSKSSGSKRLTSVAASEPPKRKKTGEANVIADLFSGTDYKNLREREVQAQEKIANATVAKLNEEMEAAKLQKRANLLRERKRLLDEGVCTKEELDQYLPLK